MVVSIDEFLRYNKDHPIIIDTAGYHEVEPQQGKLGDFQPWFFEVFKGVRNFRELTNANVDIVSFANQYYELLKRLLENKNARVPKAGVDSFDEFRRKVKNKFRESSENLNLEEQYDADEEIVLEKEHPCFSKFTAHKELTQTVEACIRPMRERQYQAGAWYNNMSFALKHIRSADTEYKSKDNDPTGNRRSDTLSALTLALGTSICERRQCSVVTSSYGFLRWFIFAYDMISKVHSPKEQLYEHPIIVYNAIQKEKGVVLEEVANTANVVPTVPVFDERTRTALKSIERDVQRLVRSVLSTKQ